MTDTKPTRDQALDLVADARHMAALHPSYAWTWMMLDLAQMIEKLVDYAGGDLT